MKLEQISEITESNLSDAAKIVAIREVLHGPASAETLAAALGKSRKTIERRVAEIKRLSGKIGERDAPKAVDVAEDGERRALGRMWAGNTGGRS